jgi:two-component system response regulator HydG
MERAVIISRGKSITPEDLPETVRQRQGTGPSITIHLGTSAGDVERQLILRTLDMTAGNKTETAKILELSLKTLHNKLNRYRRRDS